MTSRSWEKHLTNLNTDCDGNKNLMSYLNVLSSGLTEEEKIRNLTENVNDGVVGVDAEHKIMLFHSCANLGGTRARTANKIVPLIGMDQLIS